MNTTNLTTYEWDSFKLFNFVTTPILLQVAFLGNALTVSIILRFASLRSLNNTIIASLAVADMMVGLSGTAVFILEKVFNGSIYALSRKLTVTIVAKFFYQASIYSSAIHLISLGVERSIAIFLPLRYTSIVDETFIKVFLGITWLIAIILCVIYITVELIFISPTNVHVFVMYISITTNTLYFTILFSLLVMGLKTIMIVKEKRRILPGQELRLNRNKGISKATKIISLILLGFVITYTPVCLSTIATSNLENIDVNYFITYLNPLFTNLLLANSCLNIMIYSATSVKFRVAYQLQLRDLYRTFKKPFQLCYK